jgi:hypothetical protein
MAYLPALNGGHFFASQPGCIVAATSGGSEWSDFFTVWVLEAISSPINIIAPAMSATTWTIPLMNELPCC